MDATEEEETIGAALDEVVVSKTGMLLGEVGIGSDELVLVLLRTIVDDTGAVVLLSGGIEAVVVKACDEVLEIRGMGLELANEGVPTK